MDIREDFEKYDALGLADLVRRREISASELVETVIERIERVNPELNFANHDMDLPMNMYFELTTPHVGFTLSINVSGPPAISLPLHWSPEGLTVGIQFIGRHLGEVTLLRLAAQIEEAQTWISHRPPITA